MSDTTHRQNELRSVTTELHTHWLAGQIDEVESSVLSRLSTLALELGNNTEQVKANTSEQIATRARFTWLALSISISLLTTVVGAAIVALVVA